MANIFNKSAMTFRMGSCHGAEKGMDCTHTLGLSHHHVRCMFVSATFFCLLSSECFLLLSETFLATMSLLFEKTMNFWSFCLDLHLDSMVQRDVSMIPKLKLELCCQVSKRQKLLWTMFFAFMNESLVKSQNKIFFSISFLSAPTLQASNVWS